MTRLRRPAALFAGLLAVAALVLGGWAAAQFRSATLGRPWFVAATTVAVSGDGALYVGIGEKEVQRYAEDGRPESAWYLAEPAPFRLRTAAEGIEVVYASDRVVTFDASGRRRDERSEPGAYARIGPGTRADAGDARYVLDEAGLVRLAPPPARVVVPAPPPPLAWYGARPLLPITLTLLGALLALVTCLLLARKGRAGGRPASPAPG